MTLTLKFNPKTSLTFAFGIREGPCKIKVMPFDLTYTFTAYKDYMNNIFLFQISLWYNLVVDIITYFKGNKEYAL